jgi:hypothetical protein
MNGDQTNTDIILSTGEAALYLGLRAQTLRKWRLIGSGPLYIRMGRGLRARVGYRRSALDAWCADRTFESTTQEMVAELGR